MFYLHKMKTQIPLVTPDNCDLNTLLHKSHSNPNNLFVLLNNVLGLIFLSFKTPSRGEDAKNKKKYKINSRNFTYDGLTFSSSLFLIEVVKDEICVTCEKHNGN